MRRTGIKRGTKGLKRTGPIQSKRISIEPGKSSVNPIKKRTIRSLKPGEEVPPGAPRRYPNDRGYMRLRWKVGTGQYVEAYEHRVVDGVVTDAEHVHHLNHQVDDNRPDNLRPMSAAEHRSAHREERVPQWQEMRVMYEQGTSSGQVAKHFGCDESTVWRALDRQGVTFRSSSDYAAVLPIDRAAEQYEAGRSAASLAAEYRITKMEIIESLRKAGVKIRKPGRPKNHSRMAENSARLGVRRRSGGACEVCVTEKATNFQHRLAAGQGGPWTVPNGMDVCGNGNLDGCHGRIHQNPKLAVYNGWTVNSWDNPEKKQVLRRGEWVWLRPDGSTPPAPAPSLPFEEAS